MPYKVIVNTDAYKDRKCSSKNWEPGTMNDFMHAINGLVLREKNLEELYWRLSFFGGWAARYEDYEKYKLWLDQKRNRITFYDNLCEFERTSDVSVYGWAQGYYEIDKVIDEVRKNGIVRVPFKWYYDTIQYIKNMDGCYIEIKKV